jgi:hypothetical protein
MRSKTSASSRSGRGRYYKYRKGPARLKRSVPVGKSLRTVSERMQVGEEPLQRDDELEPGAKVDMPSLQSTQTVWRGPVLNLPMAQRVHGERPSAEKVPAGHSERHWTMLDDPLAIVVRPMGQDAHDVEPLKFWYDPMEQGAQGCRPEEENEPARQRSGSSVMLNDTQDLDKHLPRQLQSPLWSSQPNSVDTASMMALAGTCR